VVKKQLWWKDPDCSATVKRRHQSGKSTGIKAGGSRWTRSMESHMIETTLLILGFGPLCTTALIVLGILSACQMTLDLQEWVAMLMLSIEPSLWAQGNLASGCY